MPACGVVAGMLARCDQGGVWHRMPPVDTTLKGGLAPLVEIGQKQAAALQRMGVNTFIRLQPGVAALQGNVSFAGAAVLDALWQSLSASRLTAFVLRSIEVETRWVFTRRTTRPARGRSRAASVDFPVATEAARCACRARRPTKRSSFARARRASRRRRDVAIALRIGFAPRAPNEFLIYDFRYHASSLTTEVRPCATPSGTWAKPRP